MLEKIENEAKERMAGAIEALDRDYATLRTGRATPALLDAVSVDAYGSPTPLKQIASVSTPDAKTLVITPWDKSIMASIEKAILAANLGFTPNNDGKVIRINIPALTEERRKELVKMAHKMTETARITARNVRRHCNDELKKGAKAGDISENERDLHLDMIQEMTEAAIKKIDKQLEAKEKEILEI